MYNKALLEQLKQIGDSSCVFWGASAFLKEFIESNNLSKFNILGIIDGNINKTGKKIGNYEIFSSEILKEKNIKYVIFSILNNSNSIYELVKNNITENYSNTILLPNIFNNFIPKEYLTHFEVELARHCNLNCKGCDHFSPLAKEEYYDLEQFKKDFNRLSHLTKQKVDKIMLLGGEPLLTPNINEYLKISRDCFPETKIIILTNGILLPSQDENFWKTVKKLNIFIEYTKYEINLDYKKIDEIIKKQGVSVNVFGGDGDVIKTSYKIPLDLKGQQKYISNFEKCFHANHCITLKKGKLYPCSVAPCADNFNRYFDKDLEISENDGINIHNTDNLDEILRFLATPIPFCKYCNVKERTFGHKWGISKKYIKEWT